ncbi:Por secretion system C-terminal sorting domain-containing protein [Flavobacterium swingsii]|uniref:Por secretion system C-terminal sorting domain-containing protein n=1 Tax=Flavobacterium swingsii TaxID=498292 RepID=A0A1I0YQ91_9FLAO|nr:T9SS type A sorting domain-containing protein [Flavobacterium swingsii]SFB14630.1 Por secretion system C-terminal sorting domain-containing protein [Flavobacterium swingsii]
MHNILTKKQPKTKKPVDIMKLKYLLLFLLSAGISQAQEKKKVDFSKLDRSGMKTSLLLTDVKPFSVLAQKNETYGMYGFHQSYKELGLSDTQKRFLNGDLIKSEMRLETTSQAVKIGLIHTDFEIISKKAYDEGLIKITNNVVTRNSNNYIFDEYSNTIIAPLTLRKKGVETTFLLDSKMFVNTTSNKIASVKADFGDGKGLINVSFDKNISVVYPNEGQKQIVFNILFENGDLKIRKSSLTVTYSNEDTLRLFRRAPSLITATRNPDLAIYGVTDLSPGKCEYEVFLSTDGILDKPIFVIDGFDPSDSRNTAAVYNLLTYTDAGGVTRNLGDKVRTEEGFDVVIVNFPNYTNAANNIIDGGADFIERNALSVVTVIELINSQKTGTEQNVIIGPSMGGLISRYALRYMEQNTLNHQTRLWVSFDSPHYGANVPIGLQHLFNYFAYGYGDSDAVKPLVDGMLRSPAARQMLVDHFDAHTTSIVGVDDPRAPTTGLPLTPAGAPNYRNNFQNRMNAMGFPQTTRNVSMTNGSGVNAKFKSKTGTDILPGFDVIGTAASPANIDTGDVIGFINTRALTFCEFMPNAGVNEEIVNVAIQAQIFFWVTQDTFIARATQSAGTAGVDSAPGGLFDMGGLAASLGTGNAVLTNFLGAMKSDYFSFIPTVSAMALNVGGVITANQPNYYFNINLGTKDTPWDGINTATSNTTPFKNWFMPPTNEGHVKITQGNVDFIWCEIVKPDFNFALSTASSIVACNGSNASFTFNHNNLHGCLSTTTFSTTGAPAGSTVTFSPASISTSGTVTMNVTNIAPGTYTIMVSANNNPTKTVPVTITIYPSNPSLNGQTQSSVNSASFISGTSVTVNQGANLELNLPTSLYAGTIEWFDPTNASRGTTNPIITNIQDNSNDEGIWNARVTFTNDCARMAITSVPYQVIVDNILGINNNEFKGLSIYPNPSNRIITISSSSNLSDANARIVDLRGRTILDKKPIVLNPNNLQIDISNLSQGSYFLILENDSNRTVKQIIKQ